MTSPRSPYWKILEPNGRPDVLAPELELPPLEEWPLSELQLRCARLKLCMGWHLQSLCSGRKEKCCFCLKWNSLTPSALKGHYLLSIHCCRLVSENLFFFFCLYSLLTVSSACWQRLSESADFSLPSRTDTTLAQVLISSSMHWHSKEKAYSGVCSFEEHLGAKVSMVRRNSLLETLGYWTWLCETGTLFLQGLMVSFEVCK